LPQAGRNRSGLNRRADWKSEAHAAHFQLIVERASDGVDLSKAIRTAGCDAEKPALVGRPMTGLASCTQREEAHGRANENGLSFHHSLRDSGHSVVLG
jgi:hypothetical protein